MRTVWERKRQLRGWNSPLNWIKSGTASKVYDTPYEIYEKSYGPTPLSLVTVAEIAMDITGELNSRLATRRPKLPKNYLVEMRLTGVAKKGLDTRQKARAAFKRKDHMWTFHTKRWELGDYLDLTDDLIQKLEKAAQLPSKPSWLCIVQITIRLNMGAEQLLHKSGTAKALA